MKDKLGEKKNKKIFEKYVLLLCTAGTDWVKIDKQWLSIGNNVYILRTDNNKNSIIKNFF